MDIAPPIVVCADPDCVFYRSAADAVAHGNADGAKVFDGLGRRLEWGDGALRVSSANQDAADELAAILRRWLGHMDALRESTANWSLSLLIQASVDHLGYARGRD